MAMTTKLACRAAVVALLAPVSPAAAELVGSFKDWSVYKHEAADQKLCFAASRPKDSEPKDQKRIDVYFYLTLWPKDGVKEEVMVRLGQPLKKGTDVTVTIGSENFRLFAKDDKAFVEDADAERKLVAAIRKGDRLIVKATLAAGGATTDVFSLLGISAALKKVEEACS